MASLHAVGTKVTSPVLDHFSHEPGEIVAHKDGGYMVRVQHGGKDHDVHMPHDMVKPVGATAKSEGGAMVWDQLAKALGDEVPEVTGESVEKSSPAMQKPDADEASAATK